MQATSCLLHPASYILLSYLGSNTSCATFCYLPSAIYLLPATSCQPPPCHFLRRATCACASYFLPASFCQLPSANSLLSNTSCLLLPAASYPCSTSYQLRLYQLPVDWQSVLKLVDPLGGQGWQASPQPAPIEQQQSARVTPLRPPPSHLSKELILNLFIYRVFIKYCAFFQEFSKVCHPLLASTRLL